MHLHIALRCSVDVVTTKDITFDSTTFICSNLIFIELYKNIL